MEQLSSSSLVTSVVAMNDMKSIVYSSHRSIYIYLYIGIPRYAIQSCVRKISYCVQNSNCKRFIVSFRRLTLRLKEGSWISCSTLKNTETLNKKVPKLLYCRQDLLLLLIRSGNVVWVKVLVILLLLLWCKNRSTEGCLICVLVLLFWGLDPCDTLLRQISSLPVSNLN